METQTFDAQLARLRHLSQTGVTGHSPAPDLTEEERAALAELLRRWDVLNSAVEASRYDAKTDVYVLTVDAGDFHRKVRPSII